MEDATMDPPGRLIILTLLGRCTFGTLWIPPKHVPSFTEFQRITGLSRSTLYDWMKALTEAGWMAKLRKGDDSREGIEMAVGKSVVVLPVRQSRTKKVDREPTAHPEPTTDVDPAYRSAARTESEDHGSGVSLSDTEPSEGEGVDRIAERYASVSLSDTEQLALLIQDSPTESPTDTPKTLSSAKPRKRAAKATAKDADDTAGQRINRLTRTYTDVIKLSKFMAVQAIVRTAVNSGAYTDEQIETAMRKLAAQREFVTTNTLRIALEGMPKRDQQPRRSGELGRGDFRVRDTQTKTYKGLKGRTA